MKILSITIFGLIIILFCRLFQRFRKPALVLLIILPVVLTFWWIRFPHNPFIWAKLYSAIAIAIALHLFTIKSVSKMRNYYWIIIAFITLNILEAVVQNIHSGIRLSSWPHFVNALSGILIVLSLPFRNFMTVEKKGSLTLIPCDLSWGIIICYTLWNSLFVYLEWPDFIGLQIMLMIVPLIFVILDRRLWVEARVYSLTVYMIIHFTWPPLVDQMSVACTTSMPFAKIAAVLTGVFCAALFGSKLAVPDRSTI